MSGNDPPVGLHEVMTRAIQVLDCEHTHRTYQEQNECVFLERCLPPELVAQHLLPEVARLRPNAGSLRAAHSQPGRASRALILNGQRQGQVRSVATQSPHGAFIHDAAPASPA